MQETNEKGMDLVVLNKNNLSNPIRIVRPKESLIKYIEWSELKQKLDNILDPKVKLLCFTLAYTGLRVSEIINIKKGDINFRDGYMEVLHLKSRKYERRIIPIRNELKLMLMMSTSSLNLPDKVFPYTRQYVYQVTKKHFNDHPHTFRHSFAVHFLKTSKDPMALELLRQLLGHSAITVTMEYLKVVPYQLKNALNDLDM